MRHVRLLALLVPGLLALGCAESHGRGGPGPEPMPEPMPEPLPVDAGPGPCRPEPCHAWDPDRACCDPDDTVLPERCGAACPAGYVPWSICGTMCEPGPEPEPEPACPSGGFRDMGLTGGAVTSEPVEGTVLGIDGTPEPGPGAVALGLQLSTGESVTVRLPEAHAEPLLEPGLPVSIAIDWESGLRATRIRWDGGQVLALESSSLPSEMLAVGDLSLELGATLCTRENPGCGTERRYALQVARASTGESHELGWGETADLPVPPVDGAGYLVSFGQAVDYGCETCACFVGYHFSAVVSERYGG
ncbi:MAG TPA: hypothetical protein RMH99_29385 [Sandaracinaceae bacterium LLY-WYZ-13_1]|nr:hypothetical protein [Sandaracinaceae bacterium LLY-WYZ-13_1]